MEYGIQEDSNVAGTGPYKATAVSDTEISLVKNEAYWGGMPKVDQIMENPLQAMPYFGTMGIIIFLPVPQAVLFLDK